MGKTIFYTADEWKKTAKSLEKNINMFETALEKAKSDVTSLQDEKNACWSGPNAYKSVKSCIANFDHDDELLKNVKRCSEYVQSVINS